MDYVEKFKELKFDDFDKEKTIEVINENIQKHYPYRDVEWVCLYVGDDVVYEKFNGGEDRFWKCVDFIDYIVEFYTNYENEWAKEIMIETIKNMEV